MTIPFEKFDAIFENTDAELNRRLRHLNGNKPINGIIKYFQLIDLTHKFVLRSTNISNFHFKIETYLLLI
jgi:hypothetical protein